MKNSFLSLVLLLFCVQLFSQNTNSPLVIEKKKVYQDDVALKYKDIKTILMNSPLSSTEFKTCKMNQTVGMSFILAGTGLAALGGYLAFAESKKELDEVNDGNLNNEANYSGAMTAIGAGLACIIVSIPFSVKAKKSFRKSIDLYNSGIKATGSNPIDFRMNLTYNQIGITMRF